MPTLPAPLVELATAQLGVLARFQLRRWWSPDAIDALVGRGTLVRIERGIYRVVGGASVAQQRPFAAALRARPSATVTGPAVLGHLGVDGFAADGPFEILVRPGRSLRNVGFSWREDPRPDRPVTTCGEVRLARPGDALVHAVRWRDEVGDRTLRLGLDWMGWRGLVDRASFLADLVRRSEADPLAAELLEVIGGVDLGRCESQGERDVGAILCCFDPAPVPQAWVTSHRRADWYFVALKLVVEFDGGVDHDTPVGQRADARRDAELEAAGIQVLRVDRRDLDDVPALVARLAGAIAVRATELGVLAPRFDPTGLAA